jgi:CheY-like chemotaxis protein
VIVEVEDDGPGIPNDVLPRLFEPFFTTKPVGAGTGLGLSVSLGIVEQHGGTLRAENRAGGQSGARFVVELPAFDADPSLPDRDDAVPMDQRETQIPSTSAPRVLVVDDESPIRHALRRFFVKRNWLVDEAEDGGAALHAIQSAPSSDHYALVISDLRMPGVSGIELHDRLAMAHPSMLDRVIFTTGDVVSAEAAEFVARTTCVVLEKPFEFSALDDMIRRAETED